MFFVEGQRHIPPDLKDERHYLYTMEGEWRTEIRSGFVHFQADRQRKMTIKLLIFTWNHLIK